MKDLGLIFIGSCGLSSTPHTPRKARRFTWDIVADLGIPRTLEVLKGKPVVYLSSLTQSNLEITKLVSPVDSNPFKYDIRIDERFHNCTIDDINEIFNLIWNYVSDPSTEFNVPLGRIENMLTTAMNVSNIVVAEPVNSDWAKDIHVFSDTELKAALPKDKYEKITDPNFEDTAIIHNHIPYIIAMSTRYTESENMWFLRKYASNMPPDKVEQLIGTMLEITNQSMLLGKDRTEGPTVAIVLDYSRPFGERLVNVHARDKAFPSKVVSDIMNSKIKLGNFTIEGRGKYRLLFVTIDKNLSLPDPTSCMNFNIDILELLRPPFNDDLSLTEQRQILELIEKNTVGLRNG